MSKVKKEQKISPSTKAPSIISGDMSVTGNLISNGEVQVDGHIKGDVKCSKLTIGQEGSIEGTVCAEHALLRGKIVGEISAKSVTLMSSATVMGDVIHEALTIEPGAYIEGHCKRLEPASSGAGKNANIDLVVTEKEAQSA